eukprot:10942861-Heterocapsa_arctica.AAC.1
MAPPRFPKRKPGRRPGSCRSRASPGAVGRRGARQDLRAPLPEHAQRLVISRTAPQQGAA